MNKTNELRDKLTETFLNKSNWNKLIDIDGEKYIYVSAVNEIRKLVNQSSGTVAILVGTFILGKRFMWCC